MTHSDAHWQHQFIQTNRINLHYVTQGSGDLVLLLHGFPEFWYAWRFQIPVLSRHFKVVVPDLRGYNDSDKPTSGYDLDTLTQDILGLIKNLGFSKAHIVGHGWGGMIGWNLAQKFPESLLSLSLLSAPHPQALLKTLTSNLEQLRQHWYLLALPLPNVPEWLLQQNLASFLQNWFQGQAIRKAAFSTDTLRIYQAALSKTGALSSALNYYRTWLSPQTWLARLQEPLRPIQVPTLVLWGQEDAVLSPTLTEGFERLISLPFRLKLIPECGHWIQQEVPQVVNLELLSFLRNNYKLPQPSPLQ
ncbi:MAG: alpha/beta hydrolase [Thermosynechococcaceae cyanobacterium]